MYRAITSEVIERLRAHRTKPMRPERQVIYRDIERDASGRRLNLDELVVRPDPAVVIEHDEIEADCRDLAARTHRSAMKGQRQGMPTWCAGSSKRLGAASRAALTAPSQSRPSSRSACANQLRPSWRGYLFVRRRRGTDRGARARAPAPDLSDVCCPQGRLDRQVQTQSSKLKVSTAQCSSPGNLRSLQMPIKGPSKIPYRRALR